MPTPAELGAVVAEEARQLGFAAVGFSPAVELATAKARMEKWLRLGYGGEMAYLSAEGSRADPRVVLPRAQTVVSCLMSYAAPEPAPEGVAPHGRIARYARGADYHIVIKKRLAVLAERVCRVAGADVAYRVCVDTAPLLERELAAAAGLGFLAKNTLLISPGVGSFSLLGELLVSVDMVAAAPQEGGSGCGRCTACIEVCPTRALVGGQLLDARRCISYLTIELDGPIPRDLRPLVGDSIFGCDLCQEVCPWNVQAPDLVPLSLRPRPSHARPSLRALLGLNGKQFQRYVRGSAMRRVRRRQLLRNVCVALGNVGGSADLPALEHALEDRASLVRGHAAWALGRLGAPALVLERAQRREREPYVCEELSLALQDLAKKGDGKVPFL